MEVENKDNDNPNEQLEVGEILARLNAGVISREEAQTALEKFNTSPTRVIENEADSIDDDDDDDDDNGHDNQDHDNTTTTVDRDSNLLVFHHDDNDDLPVSHTVPVPLKRKRGRPKKNDSTRVASKPKKNNSKSPEAVLKMFNAMTKRQKKSMLKQLKKMKDFLESDSESESSDSNSDIEEDNNLDTHYNIDRDGERFEDRPNPNRGYRPVFHEKRIDLNDRTEYDFDTMLGIVTQINKDKCSKSEAQRRVCEYLNRFYAVVTNQSHETIIVYKIYKREFGYCDLAEMTINSFRTNMSNLDVVYVLPNDKVKVRKLGEFYIESPFRLNYNRIVFNPYPVNHPNAASSKDLNMFTGLPFSEEECRKCYDDPAVKEKMEWIRKEYILKTISNQDEFTMDVFEHWFGAKIKEPWRKLNWMVLFYGGFGSGKSTLMRKLIKVIFGVYCKIISDIKSVFGEFDSIKRNALIIMLDENVAPETKAQEAKLTSEITSTLITANEKFKKTEQIVSFHEYIGGVNPKNKVFLKLGDRRVYIIKTNEEMTLTHQWEDEKVDYWEKVNAYLDDVRVVKAYQYHLQCMLKPNPNIKIGLHAPYSKIKDELMLLQSPDSLSFAKIIIERGFIVPQSRLQDCRSDLLKYFTNLQGRMYDEKTKSYDSPWVREISTKDVEKEFRRTFPHSNMKNNTLWRELAYIFDIKMSDEERIREASKNGNSILMTRFHKNPNVKTKITNVMTFTQNTKPSLIKNVVDKNGKIKSKTYYLWPSFFDAYTQFTSKTKIIIELSPAAKAMFETERNNLNKRKRDQDPKIKKIEMESVESMEEVVEEEEEVKLISRPLKKRRLQEHQVSAPITTTEVALPQTVVDQLKGLMEELKATKEKQMAMEQLLRSKLTAETQTRVQVEQSKVETSQVSIQPTNVVEQQQEKPIVPVTVDNQYYGQNQQQQQQTVDKTKQQVQTSNNNNNNNSNSDHFMPYPTQSIIENYNPFNGNQMHFDSQHQSQDYSLFDSNSNQANNTNVLPVDNVATMNAHRIDNEDSFDVPVIQLATPMLTEEQPEKVIDQQQKNNQSIMPKRMTSTKLFRAMNQ